MLFMYAASQLAAMFAAPVLSLTSPQAQSSSATSTSLSNRTLLTLDLCCKDTDCALPRSCAALKPASAFSVTERDGLSTDCLCRPPFMTDIRPVLTRLHVLKENDMEEL